MEVVRLAVEETAGIARREWPVTRGVPLAQGVVRDVEALRLWGDDGEALPAQYRVLGRWPDGSLKWVLVDAQVDVAAEGVLGLQLGVREGAVPVVGRALKIAEDGDEVRVDTGALCWRLDRRRFGLFTQIELGEGTIAAGGGKGALGPDGAAAADAWVRIREGDFDGGTRRRLYGMGGVARASLGKEEYAVEIEEQGPLRAVLRLQGAFEADVPMHHYSGYRPCRFETRLHFYAGQAFVRVLHTVIATCNPREVQIEEIGLHLPFDAAGARRYRVGVDRLLEGDLPPEDYLLLAQAEDRRCVLERHRQTRRAVLAEGERAPGWVALAGEGIGLGIGLRYMAEEYPKALGLGRGGIDVFPWRHGDGAALRLGRYAEEVAWHEGEGVYSDGTGTAKTTEFFVMPYAAADAACAVDLLQGLLKPPHLRVAPAAIGGSGVFGDLVAADASSCPQGGRLLDGFADWMLGTVYRERWYGYLDWGDVLATWEEEVGDWRFRGRWGWCNSEWDPRHALWMQYARTGRGDYFDMAEAMTRHSVDVDTCHWHPYRPYMVGGCFRHSLDHFGDEPCASHTFVDNWAVHYWMTGDGRTREAIQRAGEFFLRYRWSEDPAYSFSLRSIANTLRGLLYAWEVCGDERFMRRAEEVFAVIARGQNTDGSWHKRFQVSTPDKLPLQAPYGMATEGATLAVEMGTAPPFSDDEYRALGGSFTELKRVLPYEEQKGYQTHYLMIGLELMHRLTDRDDVKKVYLKGVDWFCGGPGAFDEAFALGQHYGGILCRHLGYAYALTGQRRYLEVGRHILRHLIATQDWGDDPRRRGSVGMNPTYLSLMFFGVPYFLAQLQAAGMEE